MKPIYKPKGPDKKHVDYAINIYTGCPHRCYYCLEPFVQSIDRETFHSRVEPRTNIVKAVKKQLSTGEIKDKLIYLCFNCDPYPTCYDSSATREIIKIIKSSGNHVQILTKNGLGAERDFDLLDEYDWFGVNISSSSTKLSEPGAPQSYERLYSLIHALEKGIKTWVSCDPVLEEQAIYDLIWAGFFDKIKIGKLNYHPSKINWAEFGRRVESLCIMRNCNYTIKDSLRKEMENYKLPTK